MNTKEKVITVLAGLSGVSTVTEEDTLSESLGLDSLSHALMILELEDAFEIQFKEADMNPFDLITVADVVALVERYVGGKDE